MNKQTTYQQDDTWPAGTFPCHKCTRMTYGSFNERGDYAPLCEECMSKELAKDKPYDVRPPA